MATKAQAEMALNNFAGHNLENFKNINSFGILPEKGLNNEEVPGNFVVVIYVSKKSEKLPNELVVNPNNGGIKTVAVPTIIIEE